MCIDEQRIAIAEACGWRLQYCLYHNGRTWHNPDGICGDGNSYSVLPNYLNDLNAMHEAEKVLTEKQQEDYAFYLSEITTPITGESWCIVHATASQRAETFLKTLDLWKEDDECES